MAQAINQDKRVEATDIVVTAIDAAIDQMQAIRREIRETPGTGIGISGYAACMTIDRARDCIAEYQNDAAYVVKTYGYLVK